MSFYEIHAIPKIIDVVCPKHREYMKELRNGILGEKLWYCQKCDRPYYLKPTMMREAEFDREELDRQVKGTDLVATDLDSNTDSSNPTSVNQPSKKPNHSIGG